MKVLVFDTETTGLPINRHAPFSDSSNWPYILQLSWALYDTETCRIDVANHLIKIADTVTISEKSQEVHGITREKANLEGICIKRALNNFRNATYQADIISGHNLNFDKSLIMAESHRNNSRIGLLKTKKYVCTMKEGINLCKIIATNSKTGETYYKFPKLSQLSEHLFNETPQNTHDALVDVLVCLRCLFKMNYNVDLKYSSNDFTVLNNKFQIYSKPMSE